MMYLLHDLLSKMGAPDLKEKGRLEWFYFDPATKDIGGAAEIRFEAGGEKLIAELRHIRSDYEDDTGTKHEKYIDTFKLAAERTARPGHYRILSMTFDGATYDNPQREVAELGLSVFHAKALDISIRMVEETFNKEDILEPVIDPKSQFRTFLTGKMSQSKNRKPKPAKSSIDKIAPKPGQQQPAPTAVIIPFRPRSEVRAAG